jgi:hypothetical protein
MLSTKMPYGNHIPIYSSAYQFTKELYRIKLKLPKSLKYDLGKDACDSSLKILKCIVVANTVQEKGIHISRLLLAIEVQWVLMRLLFDFKGITEQNLWDNS